MPCCGQDVENQAELEQALYGVRNAVDAGDGREIVIGGRHVHCPVEELYGDTGGSNFLDLIGQEEHAAVTDAFVDEVGSSSTLGILYLIPADNKKILVAFDCFHKTEGVLNLEQFGIAYFHRFTFPESGLFLILSSGWDTVYGIYLEGHKAVWQKESPPKLSGD